MDYFERIAADTRKAGRVQRTVAEGDDSHEHRDPRFPIVFVAAITIAGLVVAVMLGDERLIVAQIVILLMLVWLIQYLRS
jgi:hypothetical protein